MLYTLTRLAAAKPQVATVLRARGAPQLLLRLVPSWADSDLVLGATQLLELLGGAPTPSPAPSAPRAVVQQAPAAEQGAPERSGSSCSCSSCSSSDCSSCSGSPQTVLQAQQLPCSQRDSVKAQLQRGMAALTITHTLRGVNAGGYPPSDAMVFIENRA